METPTLRQRAERANEVKAAKQHALAQKQAEDAYTFMGGLADKGLFEGTYKGPLCEEAIKMLREGKVKVRDDGESVANVFHLEW